MGETDKKIIRRIVESGSKKTIKHPIIDKKPGEVVVDKPTEAEPPKNIDVAGWKGKLEEKKKLLAPKILKPKSELWDKRKETMCNEKNNHGFVVIVYGKRKAGKTNFSLTPSRFEGITGKTRTIPKGYPVYVLDTEEADLDEAETNFATELADKKIIIESVFVEDEITKEIDPVASMDKMQEWAYALQDETEGTIVIDTFTDYCNWAKWKLEELKNVPHNAVGKEVSRLGRFDYGWLYKRIDTFLRTLRHMKLNVILIVKAKDEWINPEPTNPYSGYKTGEILADVTNGSDYWVDVICRYEKEKHEDGSVERRLIVEDSRKETVDMKGRQYVLKGNPTFKGLINLFKDLL